MPQSARLLPVLCIISVSLNAFFIFYTIFQHIYKPTLQTEKIYAKEDHLPPLLTLQKSDKKFHVGLQAGHWKNRELPTELNVLREADGASGSGKMEWEVNLSIARIVQAILEKQEITVDVLTSTIPEKYKADVFVAIHSDQHLDHSVRGAKVSSSIYDNTGKALFLVNTLEKQYLQATTFPKDYHLTRNMTEYYPFNRTSFRHSIDPETIGAIIETGFMSNKDDADLIVHHPEIAGRGIANGIIEYLNIL
jgi:hypothetical protein